jgi:Tol biopolymer transport system component
LEAPSAWNLDSASFVVTAAVDGDPELFLVRNRFDTAWVRLTERPGLDHSATWSPDGEWITYHADRGSDSVPELDLYMLRPGGRVPPVRLTDAPGLDYLPAYAPDGRHIAFLSRRPTPDRPDGSPGHIHMLGVVGQEVRQVTCAPVNASLGPAWMPDGESLLIARRVQEDGPTILVRVWLDLNRRTGRPLAEREEVLVRDGLFNYTPVPSPDGRRIAWTAEDDDAARVMTLDLETGARREVTDQGFQYVEAWTPDGAWLAVTRWDRETGRREIWLVDPEGVQPAEPLLPPDSPSASGVAFRPPYP